MTCDCDTAIFRGYAAWYFNENDIILDSLKLTINYYDIKGLEGPYWDNNMGSWYDTLYLYATDVQRYAFDDSSAEAVV
jgi:hypothetical protein